MNSIRQANKVKHNFSNRIFNFIIKFKTLSFYRWIYRHPIVSVTFLILLGIIIIGLFINFVVNYVV